MQKQHEEEKGKLKQELIALHNDNHDLNTLSIEMEVWVKMRHILTLIRVSFLIIWNPLKEHRNRLTRELTNKTSELAKALETIKQLESEKNKFEEKYCHIYEKMLLLTQVVQQLDFQVSDKYYNI